MKRPASDAKAKRKAKTKRNARAKVEAKVEAPSRSSTPKPAPVLGAKQRKQARALAHHLNPLVQVSYQGVTDAVVKQVQAALEAHELIKVRLHEPEDKRAMAQDLATRSLSALCGLVGHTVILYRPRAQKPVVVLG